MTTPSNEAKTPLANVSSGKDNLLDADPTRFTTRSFAMVWNEGHNIRLINRTDPNRAISIPWDELPALRELLSTTRPIGDGQVHGNESSEVRDAAFHRGVDAAKGAIRSEECEHEFCKATFINAIARKCGRDPITQPTASAAAQTQDVIDHSPASPPESESSKLAEIDERWSGTLPQVQFSGAVKKDIDTLRSIIDSLQAEKDDRLAQLLYTRNERDQGSARIRELLQERDSAASNMKAEVGAAWRNAIVPDVSSSLDPQEVMRSHDSTVAELAASNMKAEIVKRVREKAAEWDAMGVSTQNVLWGRKADAAREVATEIEAIEVKDDPYPCPRCGAPDTANLATPPEVSIGCRECGWEAVTIKEQEK